MFVKGNLGLKRVTLLCKRVNIKAKYTIEISKKREHLESMGKLLTI